MKPTKLSTLLTIAILFVTTLAGSASAQDRVKTANGTIEGISEKSSGIRAFKGIPFAAAPVGDLRWQAPQAVKDWKGMRKADQFGPRCMQRAVFGDMGFRSNGMSEDCLYLNVWTPAKSSKERLPVLVYFYGGGFVAGDGSEPRYDGESMAHKGIVAITVNYRLGVFGFLAHPQLSKESSYHASGNYGLLDQNAALLWVQKNIAAFGGDPKRVTIAGESAGSLSVSAQMASPLSKDLIAGAIGESGSIIATLAAVPLADGEQNGIKFATSVGATNLEALRAMTAEQLLEATAKPGTPYPAPTIDGYLFPKSPVEIYAAGTSDRIDVSDDNANGRPDAVVHRPAAGAQSGVAEGGPSARPRGARLACGYSSAERARTRAVGQEREFGPPYRPGGQGRRALARAHRHTRRGD
jgi:para-nitrobenzyl esterase